MHEHPVPVFELARRQGSRHLWKRQRPRGWDFGQPLRAESIAFDAVALEAQGMVPIRLDDAPVAEQRLPLRAGLAQTADRLRQVVRSFGHPTPLPGRPEGRPLPATGRIKKGRDRPGHTPALRPQAGSFRTNEKADLKVGLYQARYQLPTSNQCSYLMNVNFAIADVPLPNGHSSDPLLGRAVARTRT